MNKEESVIPMFTDGSTLDPGLTIRDYFAAQALQGILAVHASPDIDKWQVAVDCYQHADMLLKAREQ